MNRWVNARFCGSVVLLFLGLILAPRIAPGQVVVSEQERAAALLPAPQHAVVERLMSLEQLPAGTWKMHPGDLPHGEATDLDDSGWQPVALLAHAPNDAVWFRQTVQIPDTLLGYDLTGARIWVQFHASANGPMPEMIYFNGRRVAMGEDLEPIVLFDDAHPGDKIVVAVKLLHTVDVKIFRGATMRVEFAQNRPNPEDLEEEFLSASVLLPSFAPGDQSKLDTVNAAIGTVEVASLDTAETASGDTRAQDEAKFDASLKAAQAQMESLRPLLQTATVHLSGNSHIDAAWLWPWTETVDVVRRTFSTALQLIDEYPGYTFTQSAAAYNEWMADKYPDLNAEIKKRIEQGRWEIVGGMWVEPDLNMPAGESLVRQLLVGKRWYKQAYGVDVRIGWNPDSFGYNWQLPQIYKKSGVDYFLTQKMSWNDTNKLPFKLFWWQSPDGSKVLTYFPNGYGNDDLRPLHLGDDLAAARNLAPGMDEIMDLYGVGDHGGGPTRAMLDQGFHWDAPDPASIAANGGQPVTPHYEFGTAQSFFSALEKEIAPESKAWNYQSIAKGYTPPPAVPGKISIPTWDSELYFEYHRGVMTTQAMHKHNMRVSEEEMLNAEKWSSLAWLDGAKYPADELTEDWKKVLFNQFHDLAAGSGIAMIYKDAQKDYDWVRMSTGEISAAATQMLAEHVNTTPTTKEPNSQAVVLFNPLGWKRSGDVTVKLQLPTTARMGVRSTDETRGVITGESDVHVDDETGETQITIHVDDIPALGYKVVALSPETAMDSIQTILATAKETASSMAIDNQFIRVIVDKGAGCITSVFDKRSNTEALGLNACGNQLQFFKDTPKQYDAWNIDPGTLDVPPITVDKADSVELVGKDSTDPAIRVTSHWQNSKFVQTISLKGDIVDIDNDIDWHESHVLLKTAFPLNVTSDFATYEIPYGTIERPTTRDNSWEKAQFEVPALRWADLSGAGPDGKIHGLSILNQDKYGYDAAGNVLRLTLLRSPTWPDPDADQGHQHFHYALYPHAGTWKDALTVRHGFEYDYPLQAVVTTAHAGSLPPEHSFASVEPDDVVLTAVKKAEDANGLIFRVYEWAGKETTAVFHVPPGATAAAVTNLMEQPEGDPLTVDHDVVKVPIHPYEILTIRVDYPKAGSSQ
jgi:alpha-mannosidase